VNTPVRWLEASGDAPSGAADLLSAAAPPPVFSDAVRYRLAVGVAKTAVLPATSLWSSLLVKGALVATIGGASGFVVHAASRPAAPVAPVSAPAHAPAAVAEQQPDAPVAVEALPTLLLPTALPADRAPRLKLDPRLQEVELLEQARSLVGSNPAGALKLTAEHSRDFPKGRLGAEADLIAAQSLLAMGKVTAAKQRAKASLSRYPNGLYARQLREIVEQ
jgi:TolA-binding protein